MTHFFASCERLCEECGEVSVTHVQPILVGENRQEIWPPKNPPHGPLADFSYFITLNFWERFCAKWVQLEGLRAIKRGPAPVAGPLVPLTGPLVPLTGPWVTLTGLPFPLGGGLCNAPIVGHSPQILIS